MTDLADALAGFLSGGDGLWLAPGSGEPPEGCLVVSSSGSTGAPKPIALSRAALRAAAEAATMRLGFTATWHLTLSPSYVAGLMVMVRGILGEGVIRSDASLNDLNRGQGRACVSIVATQLYRALGDPALTAALAQFDAVLVGGSSLRPELRARAEKAGVAVIETYGMSETCGGVVWDGRPLPGVDVRIGEGGRIAIAGPSVFSGYIGRDDLTAATLVGGAVLTSDRGHLDGERLVVDGRIDDVVISGGVNVDLAVVRAAVAGFEPESAVFAVEDAEWGARVVLFAPKGGLEQWRDRLRGALPAAYLPRQVVHVAPLPRTAGGKPDRGKLLHLARQ